MAVFRNKQKHFFTSVDAAIVRGNVLSLAALGLLTVLLDRPAWWEVHPSEIARTLGVEAYVLEPLFSELEQKGFLKPRRGEKGRFYDVYECPTHPAAAPPLPEPEPAAAKQPLLTELPERRPPDAGIGMPEPPQTPADASAQPQAPYTARSESLRDFHYPDPTIPGQPMSDRNRAYALQYIREHFPIMTKRHDLNAVIKGP